MTALLVILAILFLLFLLTLVPLQIKCTYRDKLELQIKILFFTYRIMDTEQGEDTQEAVEKPEEALEREEKTIFHRLKDTFKREGLSGFLSLLRELTLLLVNSARRVSNHLHMKLFVLHITAGGEDAAAAAMHYGQACAVVPACYGQLFSHIRCRNKQAKVEVDYQAAETKIVFECQLHIKILFLLTEFLRALVKGMPVIRRLK